MKTMGLPAEDGRIYTVTNCGDVDVGALVGWVELPLNSGPNEFYMRDGAVVAFTNAQRTALREFVPGATWSMATMSWRLLSPQAV